MTVGPRPAPALEAGLVPGFQNLMPWRVQDILLVSSLYDSFTLQEDGRLNELVLSEFLDLNLHHTPGITHVASGADALALARAQHRFNLIITTPHLGDMDAATLAREVEAAGLDAPVVVLAYDSRELADFVARHGDSAVDRAFQWQGDARILIAIVKYVEDRRNVAHDTAMTGVRVILLVEDNIRYYSSFLPVLYSELIDQSERLLGEGVNLSHKLVRLRARPKILLCSTYEEAWEAFTTYGAHVLGLISDIEFPRGGVLTGDAGFALARSVREQAPDTPMLLQSSRPENEAPALEVGASFLLKGSPTLNADLRRFMVEQFAFGDFVFRRRDGSEVGRASDLRQLEEKLRTVPAESIGFHGERNHFSNWFTARTEFGLAQALRPRRVSDFASLEDLRRALVDAVVEYRHERSELLIGDFDRAAFDPEARFFSRIGGGSLGGKARGLAFVRHLLGLHRMGRRFPGVRVGVPPAVVIATDVFDRFLAENDLLDFALETRDDALILARFLAARLPDDLMMDLAAFLDSVRIPLAVRSSSLLEDSQYQPFTGVYETFMLANDHPDLRERMLQLVTAIKRVYASTFSQHAKAYLRATPFRLEEEKMAVVVQKVLGGRHGPRFYPDFSGVARSHNYYPTPPLRAEDGIAAVALGLGRAVVEGEKCLTFCPRYPQHLLQFSSSRDMLRNSQRDFWALDVDHLGAPPDPERALRETRYDMAVAEQDGTLQALASTYSRENDVVYDGAGRPGVRLVTFAPVLKHGLFPLGEILGELLDIGRRGMNKATEIEFAVRLGHGGEPHEFGFLQMRPLVMSHEGLDLEIGDVDPGDLVCRSGKVLGHGVVDGLCDVVVVDFHRFDRANSRAAAAAVARFNAQLLAERRPYLLIGVGRWGSTDPWLGIPVTWDEIAGARVIVEAGFRDMRVTPSQGSHFFQNLTSFQVGYFTANPEVGDGLVAWDWLAAQRAREEVEHVRHLRFAEPLVVRMNGRRNEGVIFRPGRATPLTPAP
jgi:CheY-like chemotaxis protein